MDPGKFHACLNCPFYMGTSFNRFKKINHQEDFCLQLTNKIRHKPELGWLTFLECLPSMDKLWVCPQHHINWIWLHTPVIPALRRWEAGNPRSSLLGSVSGASLDYMRY